MHELSLYEKKIIEDLEFPIQIFRNDVHKAGTFFSNHWHEHLEIHYIVRGEGTIYCNEKALQVKEGSLVIINCNELHQGVSKTNHYDALVLIFEMDVLSKEMAGRNIIFKSLIENDDHIREMMVSLCEEESKRQMGYKLAIKGKLYELITYLLRHYAQENLSEDENIRRLRNLDRLNIVIKYIQDHYAQTITNQELSKLLHLSEYRFCHLFKEIIGESPLNYINGVRLKKAHHLLEQKELTVSEIALAVGFQDYNNFGRLFKKQYGIAPSKVWEK